MKELASLLVVLLMILPLQQLTLPGLVGPQQVILQPNSEVASTINVQLTGSYVDFSVNSSSSVNVYLVSSFNYSPFSVPSTASAIFSSSGTLITESVGPLIRGVYYIVIYNPGPSEATLNLKAWTEPVDIYKIRSGSPAPVGIADYGVANYSGTLSPYIERFNEIIGYATIYSLNATPKAYVLRGSTISLQLNVMLIVNGSQESVYWLQNVALFNTNEQKMYFEDSIWNADSIGAQISQGVSGNGRSYGEYYAYVYGPVSYSLPINVALLISAKNSSGAVILSFGYQVGGQSVIWYDNVSLSEKGVSSAYMEVNGYGYSPVGNFYDAEFVFGGPANGGETYVNEINASLRMEYIGQSGPYLPRQLYGFGSDTAETAYGAGTRVINGLPFVLLGQVNLEPLYEAHPPLFSAIVALPKAINEYVNLEMLMYSKISGGLPPYTFLIFINGKQATELESFTDTINETIYLPPLPSGYYNITVLVKDSAGSTLRFTFNVQVVETPLAWLLNGENGLVASLVLAAIGLVIYFISKRLERNNLYYGYLITNE